MTAPFLRDFPFLGTPYDGFNNPAAASPDRTESGMSGTTTTIITSTGRRRAAR